MGKVLTFGKKYFGRLFKTRNCINYCKMKKFGDGHFHNFSKLPDSYRIWLSLITSPMNNSENS